MGLLDFDTHWYIVNRKACEINSKGIIPLIFDDYLIILIEINELTPLYVVPLKNSY